MYFQGGGGRPTYLSLCSRYDFLQAVEADSAFENQGERYFFASLEMIPYPFHRMQRCATVQVFRSAGEADHEVILIPSRCKGEKKKETLLLQPQFIRTSLLLLPFLSQIEYPELLLQWHGLQQGRKIISTREQRVKGGHFTGTGEDFSFIRGADELDEDDRWHCWRVRRGRERGLDDCQSSSQRDLLTEV